MRRSRERLRLRLACRLLRRSESFSFSFSFTFSLSLSRPACRESRSRSERRERSDSRSRCGLLSRDLCARIPSEFANGSKPKREHLIYCTAYRTVHEKTCMSIHENSSRISNVKCDNCTVRVNTTSVHCKGNHRVSTSTGMEQENQVNVKRVYAGSRSRKGARLVHASPEAHGLSPSLRIGHGLGVGTRVQGARIPGGHTCY